MKSFWRVVALCMAAAACSEHSTEPRLQAAYLSPELNFFRFTPEAYQQAQKSGSFWAVYGESRTLRLRYEDTGERFLEFEVDDHTLQAWPDGRRFAEGDSVLISVLVSSDGRFAFTFSPSGLTFNPADPARLELRYSRTSPDIDADGDVDRDDDVLELRAAIWKQESLFAPWFRTPTFTYEEDEAEGRIFSFTAFSMAAN